MNADKRQKNILPDIMDEHDISDLFYGLEKRANTLHAERVSRIMDLLVALETSALSTRDRGQTLAALRRSLDEYRWTWRVSPSAQGLHAYPTRWAAERSADDDWEYGAVAELLRLVNHPGALARLRRCEVCSQWLFAAGRSDQKFCSAKCRQFKYDNDPEKHEERLAHLRAEYRNKKEREKNPKNGVGLRSSRQPPVAVKKRAKGM